MLSDQDLREKTKLYNCDKKRKNIILKKLINNKQTKKKTKLY